MHRPKEEVRCFHFDLQGKRKGMGCERRDCHFVHPGDPGWDTADISRLYKYEKYEQPPGYIKDNGYRGRRHDYNLNRPEHGSPHRPSGNKSQGRLSRSPPRHSRESRSPAERSRRRDDGWESSSRGRQYEEDREEERRRRGDDPAGRKFNTHRRERSRSSIASSTNEPQPATAPLSGAATSIRTSLPTPPTSSEIPDPAYRDMSRPIATSSRPGMITPSTQSTNMPPPPPPTTAPAPFPPPPRPTSEIPSGSRLDARDPSFEHSREQKVTIWEDRIKILAESVQAYELLDSLNEEYNRAFQVTSSALFNILPAEDKRRLTTQVDELSSQRQGALQTYQAIQERLQKTGTFPVAPPQPSVEEKERHFALVRDVTELQNIVDKLKNVYGAPKPPPRLFLAGNESDEEEESQFTGQTSAMDVDQPSGSTKIPLPSRKRQRTDDFVGDHMNPPRLTEDMPTRKELEACHEKLVKLQDKLTSLWNECHSRDADLRQEFERELHERIEKIQHNRAEEQKQRDKEIAAEKAANQAKIQNFDEHLKKDSGDIELLAEHLAGMVLDIDRVQAELQKEQLARNESYQRMLHVEEKLKGYSAAREADALHVETLKAALKAYTTQPLSPPMSPKVPPPTYLLQSLEQPLIDALRMSILPEMEKLRSDVENIVQEKNSNLYATVWDRLQKTLTLLSTIQNRMEPAHNAPELPQGAEQSMS